jgi:hypothetical protein
MRLWNALHHSQMEEWYLCKVHSGPIGVVDKRTVEPADSVSSISDRIDRSKPPGGVGRLIGYIVTYKNAT